MSYDFKEIWCNKGNFSESNRKSSDIDTLVIHYTGNDGDTAENNGNYFKNNVVETSAHYFVDDTTVVRSVADKNIAWHAGDWDINCRSIGIAGEAISGIAIRVSKGKVKYRVHTKGGKWLNWVTGFNLEDDVNGYAGILGVEIDAVQVYYTTPKDVKSAHGSCYKATYRVSSLSENYYDWQYDDEKDSKQDGYAGSFGKTIDRVQITLT